MNREYNDLENQEEAEESKLEGSLGWRFLNLPKETQKQVKIYFIVSLIVYVGLGAYILYLFIARFMEVSQFKVACSGNNLLNGNSSKHDLCLFALGRISFGLISLGQISFGLIAIGQVSLGLVTVGQGSFSFIFSIAAQITVSIFIRYAQFGVAVIHTHLAQHATSPFAPLYKKGNKPYHTYDWAIPAPWPRESFCCMT